MEGGGLRAYGSGFRTLLGWDSAASRSASFMKWGPGRGGGVGTLCRFGFVESEGFRV